MSGARRIICVGNRFHPRDDAGPRVYDLLARGRLPDGVDVIDGGLAGVDLVRFVEGAERVVFVDNLAGPGDPGRVVRLDRVQLACGSAPAYGHAEGLAYLLHALPLLCAGDPPEIALVGIAGAADDGAVREMAEASLAWVGR